MEELEERHETFYFSSYDERKELAKKGIKCFLKGRMVLFKQLD